MNWLTRHKISLSFVVAFGLILLIYCSYYVSVGRFSRRTQALHRSHELIETFDAVAEQAERAENGQRGYLLSGDENQLRSSRAALTVLEESLTRAEGLAGNRPGQQQRLQTLRQLLGRLAGVLDETERAAGPETILAERMEGIVREAQRFLDEGEQEEKDRLAQTLADVSSVTVNNLVALSSSTAAAVALLLLIVHLLRREIGGHRKTSEALRHNEQRYRHLVDNSQAFICTHALDGTLLSVNPAAAEALGYRPADMEGRNLADFIPPANRALLAFYLERIATEETVHGLLNIVSKSGEERTWIFRNTRYEEAGQSPHVLGHAQDITERRRTEKALLQAHEELEDRVAQRTVELAAANQALQAKITEHEKAEAALRESERNFRFLADAMPQIVWTADPNGVTNYFNRRWYDYTGLIPAEFKDWEWLNVLHEEDRQRCADRWQHSVSSGEHYETEYRFRRADGTYRWHLGRGVPMLTASGEIKMWVGTCTDIDDQKRVEEQLHHAYDQLEMRVLERTQELADTNRALEATIREHEQAQEALQNSEALYHSLVEGLPLNMFLKDRDSRYTFANSRFYEASGFTPDQVLGKTNFDLYPSEAEASRREDEKVLQTGQALKLTKQAQNKTGETHYFQMVKTPIFNSKREVTGVQGIFWDVTESKRAEDEIKQARDAAIESARLKSEFLANMSHEIRTPMNGVLGMTDLLISTALSDEQRDFAETLRGSAEALLSLINDILDFSKIEAGKLHMETVDFDLRQTVESVTELLAGKAQQKHIELASLIESDVPIALRGDPLRLRQVLTNLIGNAVKFTERGEVVVNVLKVRESAGEVCLRFEVHDTGIGIPKAQRRMLFQAFTQADGSTTRKYGGTGLGLAICKQIVELMRGEIGVESQPGKGSKFWFTVTLSKQPAGAGHAVPAAPAAVLKNCRVLVVDDNATNRKILRHHFLSWEVRHDAAANGARALELLRRAAGDGKPFEVALLDMVMPDMDGFALARSIKADPLLASTRLVLLTSLGSQGETEALRDAGIVETLAKPIRQSQLFDCLSALTCAVPAATAPPRRAETEIDYPTAASSLRSAMPACKPARILLAEDNAVNRKVALSQLSKLGYQADAVNNGAEVLKALTVTTYDVILMDCQMPEIDGYEATGWIRQQEQGHKHTTIIAMTAHALEGDREKCLRAGMDDYLSKPVKTAELQRMLERWRPAEIEAAAQGATMTHSPDEPTHVASSSLIDLEHLREVADGDREYMESLIDIYLEQTSAELPQLAAAIAAGSCADVERIAHLCAGSSATCGVVAMVPLFRELERMAYQQQLHDAARPLTQAQDTFARVETSLKRMKDEG